ncbi:MAG: chitosanase, partial [Candidatus Kapaibacterium sp.]
EEAGGSPRTGVDESSWLRAFINTRRKVLMHATDPDTREAWAESVSRVDALLELLNANNLNLSPPVIFSLYGTTYRLPI